MSRVIKTGTIAFSLCALLLAGCTKYANEENLSQLESQKAACDAAKKQVQVLEGEKNDAKRELATLKADLEAAQRELENVRQ
jgi:multidrug resistance efflux pump